MFTTKPEVDVIYKYVAQLNTACDDFGQSIAARKTASLYLLVQPGPSSFRRIVVELSAVDADLDDRSWLSCNLRQYSRPASQRDRAASSPSLSVKRETRWLRLGASPLLCSSSNEKSPLSANKP